VVLNDEHILWIKSNKGQISWPVLYRKFRERFRIKVGERTIRRAYYKDMEVKKKNGHEVILTISDMHIPYHHEDSFAFLKALRDKYQPDKVVCLGDLNDWHGISFHANDPDLSSAGSELKRNRKFNRLLEEIFPEMDIIGSNHGDLPLRKIKDAGLPKAFLRSYNDIYEVGSGWQFLDDLFLESCGRKIYFVHGISKNGLKLASQRGVNVVQGHYHTEMRIDYISNPENLLWSMQAGCLIDKRSLAFAYDKLNLNRPIIGTGVIVRGLPKLLPMLLDKRSRWTGEVP
jgi:hypothetical protein